MIFLFDTKNKHNKVQEYLNNLSTGKFRVEITRIKNDCSKNQKKALHLYYQFLADELNDAGWDQRKLLKQDVEIPWTAFAIKEFLWRPIQLALTGKKSTKEIKSDEMTMIYSVVDREVGKKTGVHVPFPDKSQIFRY